MQIENKRVQAWAISRSLHAANKFFQEQHKLNDLLSLKPFLKDSCSIGLGQFAPLVFKDSNLIKNVNGAFSFPEFRFIFNSPIQSLLKIQRIFNLIKNLHSQSNSEKQLSFLLYVGLEATVSYLNFDDRFKDFEEGGCIQFLLGKKEIGLAFLLKNKKGYWVNRIGQFQGNPNVKLIFKDVQLGIDACAGKLDNKEALSSGDFIAKGKIPLLDFVGYASRVAFSEISIFKQNGI